MNKKTWIGLIGITVVLALVGAGSLYVLAFAANTAEYDGDRRVFIPREASFEAVVDSLDAAGILASNTTFTVFAKLTGWGDQVKAGHYALASEQSNYDLLSTLRRGLQSLSA